jgi:biotin operon repressor
MINWEKFVEVWQASASLEEVAEATGIKRATASKYAYRLRLLGVPLQRFVRGGSSLTGERLDALQAIAKEAIQ